VIFERALADVLVTHGFVSGGDRDERDGSS